MKRVALTLQKRSIIFTNTCRIFKTISSIYLGNCYFYANKKNTSQCQLHLLNLLR